MNNCHNSGIVGIVVTLLTYIWEVFGFNLGRDTSYPDNSFVVLFSPSRQMLGWYFC
jgi:hypothetical protein